LTGYAYYPQDKTATLFSDQAQEVSCISYDNRSKVHIIRRNGFNASLQETTELTYQAKLIAKSDNGKEMNKSFVCETSLGEVIWQWDIQFLSIFDIRKLTIATKI